MYIFPYGRTGTYGPTDGQTNLLTEASTRSLHIILLHIITYYILFTHVTYYVLHYICLIFSTYDPIRTSPLHFTVHNNNTNFVQGSTITLTIDIKYTTIG